MKRLCCALVLLAFAAGAEPTAKPAPDPAATKLLADARAARATWEHFPGFTADLEINLDGTVSRGQIEVSPKGKVTLRGFDKGEGSTWARHTLASIVGHRLDGGTDRETPCAFADDDTEHPLGRAVRVLNDEFHSSYRIRDRQVIVVNRAMADARFTITVMENKETPEKKFLPVCFTVNTWDKKTGALRSAETHHQTWRRDGTFDLPVQTTVVTATAGKLGARSLKLTHIQLKPETRN